MGDRLGIPGVADSSSSFSSSPLHVFISSSFHLLTTSPRISLPSRVLSTSPSHRRTALYHNIASPSSPTVMTLLSIAPCLLHHLPHHSHLLLLTLASSPTHLLATSLLHSSLLPSSRHLLYHVFAIPHSFPSSLIPFSPSPPSPPSPPYPLHTLLSGCLPAYLPPILRHVRAFHHSLPTSLPPFLPSSLHPFIPKHTYL